MNRNIFKYIFAFILCLGFIPVAHADIYINVMAVNGTDAPKTSSIKFDLPGELTADDILDTSGLQVDYDAEDANYFVYGDVTLKPKESKTFRVHVKDRWTVTADEVGDLKKAIDQGYKTLGIPHDPDKAQVLKNQLEQKIDYILNLQSGSTDSVDKRIDAYRAYAKELKRIQNEALNVEYWRSDPGNEASPKIIHLTLNVSNPTQKLQHYKHKDYLPAEVKPEDVVEAEDFEVRFDELKQLAFLFKEEDLAPGAKKTYTIGILDIWTIDQKDIDYLRSRTKYVLDVLKDSPFIESAKFLAGRINTDLDGVQASQAVQRPVLEHISAYRANKEKYDEAQKDVETLEKLMAVFRENLTKSKMENMLNKIKSLKSLSDISNVLFKNKFEQSTAWNYIKWILVFILAMTVINFIIWVLRSNDKKITNEPPAEKK